MDIRESLEGEHSKSMTMRITGYVGDSQERFDDLLSVMLGGDRTVSQRAAWPLGKVGETFPHLLKKHWTKLVRVLDEQGHHPAIYRNILRMFAQQEIPGQHAARVLDICFRFMVSEAQPAAVRAFSISVAASICSRYPGLSAELRLVLDDLSRLPQQPAIRVRVREALKTLSR